MAAHVSSCQLLPRFNEWGRAVAELQIKHLEGTQTGQQCPDWHFMCFGNPEDIETDPLRRHVASVLMKAGGNPCECQPDSCVSLPGMVGRVSRSWSQVTASRSFPKCLLFLS